MKRLPDSLRTPLLIFAATLLTYGVLVPHLGFYRDDWYLLVTAQSEGPTGIISLFQIDRPLLGFLYVGGYRLLGENPLAWQLATLLLRVIGNLAFWQLLRMTWPARKTEVLAIALLFSVYPGYTVQPNAGVYSTDLAANAAALLSIMLVLVAMRTRGLAGRVLLCLSAAALELLYLGIFESAIGMEVARLAFVWYVIWKREGGAIWRTTQKAFKADLLYILIAMGFLFWRLVIFQSTRRATNLGVLLGRYGDLPVRSALSIGVETLKDIFETTVLAWTVPFYQFVSGAAYRDLAIATLVAACVLGLIVLLAVRATTAQLDRDAENAGARLEMAAIGAVIAVFALLPIDLAGRNVLFADQWDRYTLYASSGVAMVVGAAVFQSVRDRARTVLILALVGMSVYVHYFSAAHYRDSWAQQRDLWQQLVWRAPGIRTGSMLFVGLPTGGYQEGYEIYGPANMIYHPGAQLQIGGDVINAATAANLQLQKNRQHYDRSVLVNDNYRNALVAIYPTSSSCLHVLDGRKIELPGLVEDSLAAEVALYSRIEMIDVGANPPKLPAWLGGYSPPPWCHYYQRMDLARQAGDWAEVARLADEALSRDLTPEDVSEWMPALEAYATLGQLPEMRHAAAIIRSDDAARAFLCLQLQRGAAYPSPYDYNQVNQALCQAN